MALQAETLIGASWGEHLLLVSGLILGGALKQLAVACLEPYTATTFSYLFCVVKTIEVMFSLVCLRMMQML